MASPTDQLPSWFNRHAFGLQQRVVNALDGTEAFRNALRPVEGAHKALSNSQIRALANTVRMCPPDEVIDFIALRATRRRKAADGASHNATLEAEATFWETLLPFLRKELDTVTARALEAVGLPTSLTKDTPPDVRAACALARTLAARALLEPLAAHCLYVSEGGEPMPLH